VVVITEDLARDYWSSPVEALGGRLRATPKDPWRTIVGVVGSVHDDGVDHDPVTIVYWPQVMENFWAEELFVPRSLAYVIRSPRTGTSSLVEDVRRAVWSVNPNLPVANVQTLEDLLSGSMARTSFTLVMIAVAASVALILGAVGVYGVTSYSVTLRTREFGVRIALGAQREDVAGLVLRQAVLLAGSGVLAGIAAAGVLSRLMNALLYGVSPVDPLTYLAVVLALTAVTMTASYLPARRAAGIEPSQALRWE
jgi:predicted lysophospholipase L1 biosynthesis ABC-type transport system permease subunit